MAKFSDESVAAALSPRRVVRKYPFPGAPGVEVAVRLLSDSELDAVRLRAVDFCSNKAANLIADPEFLDRLIQRETIARAFYDADKEGDAFFADQNEVAQLDNLTVRSLHEIYMLHAQSMDPLAFCPVEQVQELADTLGKSEHAAGILSLYDLNTARSCVLSLALKLRETQLSLSASISSSS
jgi:hypothetical protein